MDFDPLKFYKDVGRQRIRIPAAMATALGWSDASPDVACTGVFTAPGELLCAASAAVLLGGAHPLQEAQNYRSYWQTAERTSLSDLATATFATQYRVFDFNAKWTKDKAQVQLEVGSSVTHLLGWTGTGDLNPPIFPAVREQVLFLWSRTRFEELQRLVMS